MTHALTRCLATALLLASGVLACGKYGPPTRTGPLQASATAPTSTAPAAAGEACEEDEETAP
jgi:hypothetical protein